MAVLSLSSGKVFIVYTDGVTTHGAIFQRKRGQPEPVAEATCVVPEPSAAASEIFEKLKAQTSVPKSVLIATDRAVHLTTSLPVDPARPRPYAQMRELARWEAEPLFAELPDWTVADVLRATGRVSEAQHKMISAEIDHTQRPGMPIARYQDVAMRLGHIDRSTRDFAIEAQERFSHQVETPACGWQPGSGEGAAANQFNWQIAAMPDQDRVAWVEGFKAKRIKVDGFVPGWGLGAFPEGDGNAMVLERHSGAIFAHSLAENGDRSLRLLDVSSASADEASAISRALDGVLPDHLVAYGFSDAAVATLSGHAPSAVLEPDWPAQALRGLARVALGDRDAPASPRIAWREPPKPLHRNADFWRIALLLGVALAIVGVEGFNRLRLNELENKLSEIKEDYELKRSVATHMRDLTRKIDELKQQITQAEVDVEMARKIEMNAAYLQDRRSTLPVGILEAVRDAAHGGLVMQSISESEEIPEVFIASAWSLTELGAAKFITGLNANLSSLGLSVADESIFRAKGLRGMNGFSVRLRIAKKPADTRAEAAQ
ncbi:MAG: hypothetical protein AAF479_02425 [Pseudomonadota bacterium]